MNIIFFAIVAIAFAVAVYRQLTWTGGAEAGAAAQAAAESVKSPMDVLGFGMIQTAKSSVTLALGLIGVMALFLGLMKVAEAGGLLVVIAKLLRPLMTKLFPDVPSDHPAMGAMIMNMSANALGLGNAATPFGIRAMQELDKLNPHKHTATNSMALFLAINTSSVTLLPSGVIAIRAASGSIDPAGIVPTTLFATICSTTVAIVMAKLLQRYFPASPVATPAPAATEAALAPAPAPQPEADPSTDHYETESYPVYAALMVLGGLLAFAALTIFYGKIIAPWIIPSLMMILLTYGMVKKVNIYESFVEGAKDGFQVAVRIIPYLVAILVAVGMFRNSGAMELLIQPLGAITNLFGMPPEALPMALLRPLSGSGAYGIMVDTINTVGPDSYTGYLVSTFQGSTETTFYVMAVYFGAVQIRRVRHALAAALCADAAGIAGAVFIVSLLYG